MNQLKRVLFSSGGGLSTNEKIYLDSEAALIIAEEAKNEFKQATENILNVYRQGLQEIQEIWQRNVYQARQRGSMLTDWEIRDTQQMVNCNQQTILDETCQYYEKKISKVIVDKSKMSCHKSDNPFIIKALALFCFHN